MSRCKDCVHYEVCMDYTTLSESEVAQNFDKTELLCDHFKPKSRFVELPCEVGQTVYTNVAMRGWYFRQNDKPYSAKIVFIGLNNSEKMGGGFFNVAYENRGYMFQFNFSDIGKTVFIGENAREEAKKGFEREG